MATSFCLTSLISSSSSSSSPSAPAFKSKIISSSSIPFPYPSPNHKRDYSTLRLLSLSPSQKFNLFTLFSLSRYQQRSADNFDDDDDDSESDPDVETSAFSLSRPCELYVCNLPRSFDITHLLHLFKPYGTVQSVQVSRNLETGISRGCGYVTMSSLKEAKAAIYDLDGSDVDGREMRVKFSVDMNRSGRNLDALNSPVRKELIFESPYKLYVGNLIWAVKPKDLRNLFSQFGTVVSARLLHDRRGGKNRVYGFVSFSERAELAAALSLNGTDYYGRNLLLREVEKQRDT